MKEEVGLSEKSAGDISNTLHTMVKGRGDKDGNDLTPFASDSPDDDYPSKIFEVGALCSSSNCGAELTRQIHQLLDTHTTCL